MSNLNKRISRYLDAVILKVGRTNGEIFFIGASSYGSIIGKEKVSN